MGRRKNKNKEIEEDTEELADAEEEEESEEEEDESLNFELIRDKSPVTVIIREKYCSVFIITISILQIALHYYNDPGYDTELSLSLVFDNRKPWEIWRLLTVSLIHSDSVHMWSNVLTQLIFGWSLERSYGWRAISTIYIIGTIGGSIEEILPLHQEQNRLGFGASAGVTALIAAEIVDLILTWRKSGRCKKAWRTIILLIVFVSELLSVFYRKEILAYLIQAMPEFTDLIKEHEDSNPISHLGGFLLPLPVTMYLFLTHHTETYTKIHKTLYTMTRLIFISLMGIIVFFMLTKCNVTLTPKEPGHYGFFAHYNKISLAPENSLLKEACERDTTCRRKLRTFISNVEEYGVRALQELREKQEELRMRMEEISNFIN